MQYGDADFESVRIAFNCRMGWGSFGIRVYIKKASRCEPYPKNRTIKKALIGDCQAGDLLFCCQKEGTE